MLVGALYWQVCGMPAVFAGGLIVLAIGIERSILATLDTMQEKLRDKAIKTAIKEYQKAQTQPPPTDNGNANKQVDPYN